MKEEPYALRLDMARMHDKFLSDLNTAMKKKEYVKASWLCYAIFEQRITRIIEKHISKCPKGKRGKNERPVGINTKLICLKKLTKQKYGPFEAFDGKLLNKVSDWCKKRNELIHDLVRLDRYKEYDREFKELAESGVPLVNEMYKAATEVREWYRSGHTLGRFPEIKCKCSRRCIYQE